MILSAVQKYCVNLDLLNICRNHRLCDIKVPYEWKLMLYSILVLRVKRVSKIVDIVMKRLSSKLPVVLVSRPL